METKPHALLLGYFYPPAYSGEATYTHDLAVGLRRAGWQVTVVAAQPGSATIAPSWLKLVPDPHFDRVNDFERYRSEFSRRASKLLATLHAKEQWTLVHSQEWYGAAAAMEIAKRFGIPHVKTLHFIPPDRLSDEAPRWALADHWQRLACNAADHVIAVAANIRKEAIQKYQIPSENISVVHNGLDLTEIAEAASLDHLKRYTTQIADANSRVIVLSGRLVAQKGIDILIDSISSVRSDYDGRILWIICGGSSGGDSVISRYRALAARHADCVIFTGHIPRRDALGILKRADVVVAPSRFEPFGLSVLEAMLLAKPIVASAVGGHIELIDSRSGILLPAQGGSSEVTPQALANAQLRLLRNPVLAQSFGLSASRRARQLFSFEMFIKRTIEVYESACLNRK